MWLAKEWEELWSIRAAWCGNTSTPKGAEPASCSVSIMFVPMTEKCFGSGTRMVLDVAENRGRHDGKPQTHFWKCGVRFELKLES